MSPARLIETSLRRFSAAGVVQLLPGPAALTSFEAERLRARLKKIDSGVTAVEAAYLYVLKECEASHSSAKSADEWATRIDWARLRELLGDGETLDGEGCVWIAPRVGTQSPWSSKATDILRNT